MVLDWRPVVCFPAIRDFFVSLTPETVKKVTSKKATITLSGSFEPLDRLLGDDYFFVVKDGGEREGSREGWGFLEDERGFHYISVVVLKFTSFHLKCFSHKVTQKRSGEWVVGGGGGKAMKNSNMG